MSYKAIDLIYTFKCTASCRICGFSCSPKRTEKMKLEDAMRYVKEGREAGIRIAGITGGEPLLYADEIFSLIKYIKTELGMYITMTTNCFWADTFENAYKIILQLKKLGVDHLKISSDEFHSENIPYQNIINVLDARQEIDLSMSLGCVALKNSKGLKDIVEHLNEHIHGIVLGQHACAPIGRAKEYFQEDDFFSTNKLIGNCVEKNQITIKPNGDAYPCGSFCGLIENRCLGNANCMSIKELVNKAELNKTNYFISNYGIKPYYDYIRENNLGLEIQDKFVDSCDACYQLFAKNAVDKIDEISEIFDVKGVYE